MDSSSWWQVQSICNWRYLSGDVKVADPASLYLWMKIGAIIAKIGCGHSHLIAHHVRLRPPLFIHCPFHSLLGLLEVGLCIRMCRLHPLCCLLHCLVRILGLPTCQKHHMDDWMLSKVQIKRFKSCTDIYYIIRNKLCQWKLCCPGGRMVFNVRKQKILQHTDGDL